MHTYTHTHRGNLSPCSAWINYIPLKKRTKSYLQQKETVLCCLNMSWQFAMQIVKRYFPQVLLPVTITVGFIGYSIETYIRSPPPVEKSKSVSELREERRLRQMDSDQEKPS